MANYQCALRTNYFRVKDEEKFKSFMKNVYGTNGDPIVWEETFDGVKRFGFGCYGAIAGLKITCCDDDEEETCYDAFIDGLQELVADDDAIIIYESGHEALRYVTGMAEVITATDYSGINLINAAENLAETMLNIPGWETKSEY